MRQLLFLILILCTSLGFSQMYNPVKWKTQVEKISDSEYNLISIATIEEGSHLYAQNIQEGGPIPTEFTYHNDNNDYTLIGNTSEEEGITVNDAVFEMEIKYFENTAVFKQKVKLSKTADQITGSVLFMACDDEKCTPPTDFELVFFLNESTKAASENPNEQIKSLNCL
mgnify:CR=1 FL=1